MHAHIASTQIYIFLRSHNSICCTARRHTHRAPTCYWVDSVLSTLKNANENTKHNHIWSDKYTILCIYCICIYLYNIRYAKTQFVSHFCAKFKNRQWIINIIIVWFWMLIKMPVHCNLSLVDGCWSLFGGCQNNAFQQLLIQMTLDVYKYSR